MEKINNKKELEKELKNMTYKDIKYARVNVIIYTTGTGNSVYYDVYGYITKKTEDTHESYDENDYIHYNIEKMRIGGYGYDRWSTALSEALNIFKTLYKRKSTLKKVIVNNVTGFSEFYTKKGSRVYGLYENNTISYGIGVPSVLGCIENGFCNVKVNKNACYQAKKNSEDGYSFTIKGA